MQRHFLLLLIGAVTVSGCAWNAGKDGTGALLNPTAIHVAADAASPPSRAGQIPVDNYYKALDLARPVYEATSVTTRDAAAIRNYVDEGIGLVDAHCLRWFRRLEDLQRRVDLEERNFNVIRQLGTALLGIGKASSNWVTGYGAANTAYTGVVENFNGAVLTGPTTRKVKARIATLLEQSADDLRSSGTITFAQAYNRLERHADICTFNTVAEILDTSLASTQSDIEPKSGAISTKPLESAFRADDSGARLRAFWMPQGAPSEANQAKLREWMKTNGLGDVPIAMLISSRLLAQARQKAVSDLSLPQVR